MEIKLCECGCGLPTPLYKYNSLKTGAIKGQPSRFLNGHKKKLQNRIVGNTKRCPHCKDVKILDEFCTRRKSLNGITSWCSTCDTERNNKYREEYPEKVKASQLKYRQKFSPEENTIRNRISYKKRISTPEGKLQYYLKGRRALLKKRNMTLEDFDKLLKSQDYRCAICHTDKPYGGPYLQWALDHNHKTNKVRGILCDSCNRGLGHFKDSREKLLAAEKYLAKYEEHLYD